MPQHQGPAITKDGLPQTITRAMVTTAKTYTESTRFTSPPLSAEYTWTDSWMWAYSAGALGRAPPLGRDESIDAFKWTHKERRVGQKNGGSKAYCALPGRAVPFPCLALPPRRRRKSALRSSRFEVTGAKVQIYGVASSQQTNNGETYDSSRATPASYRGRPVVTLIRPITTSNTPVTSIIESEPNPSRWYHCPS